MKPLTVETSPASDRFSSLWLHRGIFLLFIFVIPLLYLSFQALLDRDSSLLPFEKEAKWVFHPVQKIEDAFHRPVCEPVEFSLEFRLEDKWAREPGLELKLMAFRQVQELRLNGRRISSPRGNHWRQPKEFELSKWLREGRNSLRITVVNLEGIPGLMVEEPPFLRTPGDWRARLKESSAVLRPVVGAGKMGPPEPLTGMVGADPGPLLRSLGSLGLSFLVPGWLVIWGVLALLTAVQFLRGRLDSGGGGIRWSPKRSIVVVAAILGVGLLIHLKNASSFAPQNSPFDFVQHTEYIDYVSDTGWVPRPTDGFQMYQPPLYYWVASWIQGGTDGSLKRVQYLGAIAGWILALVAWLLVRQWFPRRPVCHVIAALFAVSLPMVLYMAPVVSNEVFAASMIAVAFYWLVRAQRKMGSYREALMAGVLAGLALLSKFPAVFVLAAACLLFLQRWLRLKDRRTIHTLVLYVGSAALVSGWFYTRNLVDFGDPFVKAGDAASGFWYVQQPTYRTAEFYYGFGKVFFHHPERAPWISFVDGHYASFWGDLFRTFHSGDEERPFFWLSALLVLAFPPTCAMILGLLKSVKHSWLQPTGSTLLLLALPVWTSFALVSFSIELPFVSVIKAFFFLFLVPVLAVHLVQGRLLFYRFFQPLGWMHDASFLCVCGISLWLYTAPAT
jgi:hypothetical protein